MARFVRASAVAQESQCASASHYRPIITLEAPIVTD
jgi:hypothetical protein